MFRDVNSRLTNLLRKIRGEDDDDATSGSDNPSHIQSDKTSILIREDSHIHVAEKIPRTDRKLNKDMKSQKDRNYNISSKVRSEDGVRKQQVGANKSVYRTGDVDGLDGVPGGPLDEMFSARTCVAASYRSQGKLETSEFKVFDWFNL